MVNLKNRYDPANSPLVVASSTILRQAEVTLDSV